MKGILADVGLSDYVQMLELQRSLNGLRNERLIPDTIIFTEHPPTYTVGIHRNPEELLDPSIAPIEVERGGSVTYHGPGQIVAYFIINMMERRTNIKKIIESVQESIVKTLALYSIRAEGRLGKETGVWTSGRKICSIGFAIRESSTFHGIALNISTDLAAFGRIMPCGFESGIMTTLEQETGHEVESSELIENLKKNILEGLKIDELEKIKNIEGLKQLLQ